MSLYAADRVAATDDFDLESARADTPGCRSVVHLNSAGAGLTCESVVEAMIGHLRAEAMLGAYEAALAATDQLALVHDAAATLLGCSASEIAVIDNASRAWSLAVQSIPLRRGDRVLVSDSEYMSNCVVLEAVCRRAGAELQLLPTDAHGRVCVDRLGEIVDARVRLIAVPHIPICGGHVNSVAEIGQIAQQVGSLYVVDACQSLGHVPVDVDAIGCDFLTAAGRKYLRGPRGTALLYARAQSMPKLSRHALAADVYGTRWLPDGSWETRDDARRFESWETNCAAQIGLGLAVEYANRRGVQSTWPRVRSLGEHLRSALAELAQVELYDAADDGCGIVSFAVGSRRPDAIRNSLSALGINVSVAEPALTPWHPSARRFGIVLRASVHYYNTVSEIDTFVEALATADELAAR